MKVGKNYLAVYKTKTFNKFVVSSNHPMLKDTYVILKVDDFNLKITVPTIDYGGQFYKTNRVHKKYGTTNNFTIKNSIITEGKFNISDETTEDELVVYFDEPFTKETEDYETI